MALAFILQLMSVIAAAGVVSADSDEDCSSVEAFLAAEGLVEFAGAVESVSSILSESDAGLDFLRAVQEVQPQEVASQVTFFVPTDAAFEAAAAAFGGELPADNLVDILLNHAIFGDLFTGAIVDFLVEKDAKELLVQTIFGGNVLLRPVGDDIFIQSEGTGAPGAALVRSDVLTCAGPVHIVNAVLLTQLPDGTVVDFPPLGPAPGPGGLEYEEPLPDAPGLALGPASGLAPLPDALGAVAPGEPRLAPDLAPAPGPGLQGCVSIEAAAAGADLAALLALLDAAMGPLMGSANGVAVLDAIAAAVPVPPSERVTVFAPDNAAIAELQQTQLAAVPEDEAAAVIAKVLLNHVVPDEVSAAELNTTGTPLTLSTLAGEELTVTTLGSSLFLQSGGLAPPGAMVVTPDVATCAGTVHTVNIVLFPASTDAAAPLAADAPVTARDFLLPLPAAAAPIGAIAPPEPASIPAGSATPTPPLDTEGEFGDVTAEVGAPSAAVPASGGALCGLKTAAAIAVVAAVFA
eukprot:jgi/Ulvmu1/5856/UM025_0118.1